MMGPNPKPKSAKPLCWRPCRSRAGRVGPPLPLPRTGRTVRAFHQTHHAADTEHAGKSDSHTGETGEQREQQNRRYQNFACPTLSESRPLRIAKMPQTMPSAPIRLPACWTDSPRSLDITAAEGQ